MTIEPKHVLRIVIMKFLSALAAREPQIGICIMYPSPGVVERIGTEWDWVWVDGQHGQLGYADVLALVRACGSMGKPAIVRVPGHEFGSIGLALDSGAAGVIVPCVDTAEQAQAVVNAAKFPPLGKRSYGGRRPIDLGGRGYAETANIDTLLIVQIETPEAMDNIDAIAGTPGVDGLFLGPDDILLRRGYSMMASRSPDLLAGEMTAVMEACRRHGKFGCMVGVGDVMFSLSVELGFSLIVAGSDVSFLASGSAQTSSSARAILSNQPKTDTAPPISSPY